MTDATPRWPDYLEAVGWTVAVVVSCHLWGQDSTGLLVGLLVPALRLLLEGGYRRRIAVAFRSLAAPASSPIPWRGTLFFVVVPAAALFLSNERNIGSGDTWPVVPTALSLTAEGNPDLDEYLPLVPDRYRPNNAALPYCLFRHGAHLYSSYPSGMVPFALPLAAVANWTGADRLDDWLCLRLEKRTAAFLAALTVGLFFLTARQLAGIRAAVWATLLFAAGSVVFSTCAQGLWQHGGILFWTLLAVFLEFQRETAAVPGTTFLQGLACSMMLACRPSAALLVVCLGTWIIVRDPGRAVRVALVALLTYLPWVAFHVLCYGNLVGPSSSQLTADQWAWGQGDGYLGVLVSPSRGLFVYQPWLLLSLAGLLVVGRASGPPGWRTFCMTAAVLHLALIGSWRVWWGGHCWGSRLAAEAVPLLGLLAVPPLEALTRRSLGVVLVVLLLLASFAVHAPAVYLAADAWWNPVFLPRDDFRDYLWSWSRAPFLEGFRTPSP